MVGRTKEIRELQAAVQAPGDTMLVGLPGVGKSRLISEIRGEIHLIECRAKEYLTDDLHSLDPDLVVLDDSHLHLDVLEDLVRVRSREQLTFRIIAVMWPGEEARVESLLSTPTKVWLERLPRPEIDQFIQQLGVHGFRARQMILDQSDGRPGWASVLSKLVVDGSGERLTSGQYLLDQVNSLALSIAGTAALNDVLACIAALGKASLEDLEIVAGLTHVSYGDLVNWLEATAQGGVVARTGDSWTVFAALQPLMPAAWFFGARKTRRWSSLTNLFDADTRLDQTLLQVAGLVPGREALDLADEWFARVQEGEPVDPEVLDLVESYGLLTPDTADRAAALARELLATPREPETTIFGSTYDPITEGAIKVLGSAFRHSCSREALQGLLDLAVNDDRPRNSHPDHPIRVIQELSQYLDPDVGPISELRERILESSLEWLDQNAGRARWLVAAEVASFVFDPHVEGSWPDPGQRRTITISHGLATARTMSTLIDLWEEMDSRVRSSSGVDLSGAAVAYLCDVFDVWSALVARGTSSEDKPSDDHRAAALEGARRMLDTLGYLSGRFPAIPIRVNRQLALVTLWNKGPTGLAELPVQDVRLARFVGTRDPGDDGHEWRAQRSREEDSLAIELVALGAEAGVTEFQRLVTDAQMLGEPHGGESVATRVAEHVMNPQDWLREAVGHGARSMIGPMLATARASSVAVDELVRETLEQKELRGVVLRAVLSETADLDPLAEQVLAVLHAGDVAYMDDLWTLGAVTPMLRALLLHPLREVRAVAAVSFGEGLKHGPILPEDLRAPWRSALLGANSQELPQHATWRLEQMLKHATKVDPELCADWLIANADTSNWSYRVHRKLELLSEVVRALPRAQKRRVCSSLSADTLVQSGLASDLLGSDEVLAFELLSEGVINVDLLLRSLSGHRDHTIENLAPVLVGAGVDPEVIAGRTLWGREGIGSVAESIRADLGFFADLAERRPELREVAEAACARLEKELDETEAQERMDHLDGW
ncbi:ATP-binding protein [Serinicoccus profundi]|uniref:ATP-binding protein n=1 Tax=Serinicoccus profundi TaxID=1078471 RepID=UPI00031D1523|nr:ATP-binding protein [Serinicoccus profundi]